MIAAFACAKGIKNVSSENQKRDIMRGQILAFSEQKKVGVVATPDGAHRLFHINDWRSMVPPQLGMAVNFSVDEDGRARHIQLAPPEPATTATDPVRQPTQSANPHA